MNLNLNNVIMWVGDMGVEQSAISQITNISKLPILGGRVAVMPDVHMGKGVSVGTVIPTRKAVIPSAVGVDIGCGMCAVLTNLIAKDLPDNLSELRSAIESVIPVGFGEHTRYVHETYSPNLMNIVNMFSKLSITEVIGDYDLVKIAKQVGTLGGGNHFIEICLDTENRVWLMLHSGSRNIGNKIGTVAIEMAKKQAKMRDFSLVDKDLAWLDEGSAEFDSYINAMQWAQDYASLNRKTMMNLLIDTIKGIIPKIQIMGEVVNCHHNFTSLEEHFGEKMWVTRKGAVRAQNGEMGIIPGSMGAKSFIVKGKGNVDSYCSCSHGAGRKYRRKKAKNIFNLKDLEVQTFGVECKKDSSVLDEIPGAYKDIDQVMSAQKDLVDVVHTLKQVMCIKG